MKVHRTADEFLQDIVDWGERALRHASSLSREQFPADERTQDAVSRCIEAIGEAASRAAKLDPSIRSGFPEFEVDKAYAARNVLSHDYFGVDPTILWATVTQSIPKFVSDSKHIIQHRAAISAAKSLGGDETEEDVDSEAR
jgi:uncharacterized protein with HEPN domain